MKKALSLLLIISSGTSLQADSQNAAGLTTQKSTANEHGEPTPFEKIYLTEFTKKSVDDTLFVMLVMKRIKGQEALIKNEKKVWEQLSDDQKAEIKKMKPEFFANIYALACEKCHNQASDQNREECYAIVQEDYDLSVQVFKEITQ
jgi:hypothetical protein